MWDWKRYREEMRWVQQAQTLVLFWDDPVGDMLSYLWEYRPWVETIIVTAHNAKAFELHIILNRALLQVELIMNGMKIMCMRVE
jgi:hypothetical protein